MVKAMIVSDIYELYHNLVKRLDSGAVSERELS